MGSGVRLANYTKNELVPLVPAAKHLIYSLGEHWLQNVLCLRWTRKLSRLNRQYNKRTVVRVVKVFGSLIKKINKI